MTSLSTALAVAGGLIVGAAGTAGAATAAVPQPAAVSVPTLTWTDCDDGFQCAEATVPLDYDSPGAGSITLALLRQPAGDQAARLGSLFVNPGGPGSSGVDFVRGAGRLFPAEVQRRYDIVGLDPRGIAASTPLRCFDTQQEAADARAPFPFPVTPAEEQLQVQADRRISAACAVRGGAILDHMSTANVARDLDLLRQAVGDSRLNFLGLSYGSYLGQTYANMFPATVGAMVIDGVLDPVAWSTGSGTQAKTQPFTARLRSDQGAQATLRQFFALCDASPAGCAFAGSSRQRYEALADRLLAQPLVLADDEGETTVTYASLVAQTLGAMYNPAAWPSFADYLVELEAASSATSVRESLAAFRAALGLADEPAPNYVNVVEGFPGVACSETDNPTDVAAWPKTAAKAEARYQYFGRLWTWPSSICQPWPGQDDDRYTGPWNRKSATPILVVGNYYDPATRYEGAVTASRLLPGSRLLTYAGWGHTAFGGSACITEAVTTYLTTTVLPRRGTVCQPERSPFDPPPTTGRATTSQLLAPSLPEVVRRALAG